MENAKLENEEIEILNVEIGDDKPQLMPKKVLVHGVKTEGVTSEGKFIGTKMVLQVKHPQVQDLIEISSVKYLDKKDKIKTSGLWVKMDSENKINFHSAIASLLRHYQLKAIKELRGTELDTVLMENNYLCIKAY